MNRWFREKAIVTSLICLH